MQRSKSARPAHWALANRPAASLSQVVLLTASFLFVVALVAGAI